MLQPNLSWMTQELEYYLNFIQLTLIVLMNQNLNETNLGGETGGHWTVAAMVGCGVMVCSLRVMTSELLQTLGRSTHTYIVARYFSTSLWYPGLKIGTLS